MRTEKARSVARVRGLKGKMQYVIRRSPFAIRKWLLFIASIAIALLALTALALARPSSFLHIRKNLSQEADLISAFPDLAVSPDGNRVTVVWTGERADTMGPRGHVYLRTASEAGGWGDAVRVFTSTQSAEAYEAAVALTNADAHVAYIEYRRYGLEVVQTMVRYVACSLGGSCGNVQTVYSEDTKTTDYVVRQVDIALDDDGEPHVVWCQQPRLGSDEGDVYYSTLSGVDWIEEKWVDEDSADVDARPAIAWDNGYAHVVWETEQYYVQYRRWDDDGGTWSGDPASTDRDRKYPQRNPDVAAGAGHVFVVWDWCGTLLDEPGEKCEEYNVAYKLVTGTLSLSDPREVGTDMGEDDISDWALYASTDDVDEQDMDEYRLDLQPAIALNDAGEPAVIWHADQGNQEYVVYYSYAITSSQDNIGWFTPTVLSAGGSPGWAAATIGVGNSAFGGEQALHVAYMGQGAGEWDVYYDSDEASDYPHAYLPLVFKDY